MTNILAALITLVIIRLLPEIIRTVLVWKHDFAVGWVNSFSTKPWYFYLTRLPELSPFYLFSFLAPLLLFLEKKDLLLVWSSLWILGFFILWGNYQSRYVLPAVPFLLILAARLQVWPYDQLSLKKVPVADENRFKRPGWVSQRPFLWRTMLVAVCTYFILKTF